MQDCLKEKLVEEQKYRNHLLIEYLHATKQQEQQTMPGKVDAVKTNFVASTQSIASSIQYEKSAIDSSGYQG